MEVCGEHVLAERTCQKCWFWLRRRRTSWAAKKVWRWSTGSITRWRSLPNTRRARRVFESHSSSHFKTFKSSRIHSKARKLGPTWTHPRDVEGPFCMSEMLLERHKKKSFLHRIVKGDEKWIHYDNPKCKKSYVKSGQPAKSTAKPNIHGTKVMLCIWWDQKGVLYYELLKPGETINGELCWTQLIRLKRAVTEKRPEYATRHEAIILNHDNARPHVAIPVKNYLDNSGWEVLPHPPYSPDLAPSDGPQMGNTLNNTIVHVFLK